MTIQSYKLLIDSVSKLGQISRPVDKEYGTEVPYPPGGISVGKYTVGSNKKMIAQTLTLHANNIERCVVLTVASYLKMGTIFFDLGGATKHEFPIYDRYIVPASALGSDEKLTPSHNCNQTFNFGDGWICPNGTELLIKVTPFYNAQIRWVVSVYGIESSVDQIKTGKVVTSTVTANQTILSYTPSADYTILGMNLEAETAGQVIGLMRLEFCGFHCFETGLLGMEETAVTPYNPDGCLGTLYGQGVINIPLTDIEFQQGEFLEALAHAWIAKNDWFQMMLFGKEESLGGGGEGGPVRILSPVMSSGLVS